MNLTNPYLYILGFIIVCNSVSNFICKSLALYQFHTASDGGRTNKVLRLCLVSSEYVML